MAMKDVRGCGTSLTAAIVVVLMALVWVNEAVAHPKAVAPLSSPQKRVRDGLPGMFVPTRNSGFAEKHRERDVLSPSVKQVNISQACFEAGMDTCGLNLRDPASLPCFSCVDLASAGYEDFFPCLESCCTDFQDSVSDCLLGIATSEVCMEDSAVLLSTYGTYSSLMESNCGIYECVKEPVQQECNDDVYHVPSYSCASECPGQDCDSCCSDMGTFLDCAADLAAERCPESGRIMDFFFPYIGEEVSLCVPSVPFNCVDAVLQECPLFAASMPILCLDPDDPCVPGEQPDCQINCCTSFVDELYCAFENTDTSSSCDGWSQVYLYDIFEYTNQVSSFCRIFEAPAPDSWTEIQVDVCRDNLQETCGFEGDADLPCQECSVDNQACLIACCPDLFATVDCVEYSGPQYCTENGQRGFFESAGYTEYYETYYELCTSVPTPMPTPTMTPSLTPTATPVPSTPMSTPTAAPTMTPSPTPTASPTPVCVDAEWIEMQGLAKVHTNDGIGELLCIVGLDELPCGTPDHVLEVLGGLRTYAEVCTERECSIKVGRFNGVLHSDAGKLPLQDGHRLTTVAHRGTTWSGMENRLVIAVQKMRSSALNRALTYLQRKNSAPRI